MGILALLSKDRDTKATTVFEGPGTAIRTVYVEIDKLPTDQETVMAVVEFTPLGPEETSFVEFLDDHVETHEDGRITAGELWHLWAVRFDIDPRHKTIGGIGRKDAAKLFRARFGAAGQTRARIDGRVQRCWTGYRIIPSSV